jgi:hypothetical protein
LWWLCTVFATLLGKAVLVDENDSPMYYDRYLARRKEGGKDGSQIDLIHHWVLQTENSIRQAISKYVGVASDFLPEPCCTLGSFSII